jgi:hypothetical protein
MVRIFISYVLPLFLPTVIYFIWTAWVRKQIAAKHAQSVSAADETDEVIAAEVAAFDIPTPWFRLALAGVGLVLVGLMLSVFFAPKNPPGSVYQAPYVKDGKVVPGQFVPKPNQP